MTDLIDDTPTWMRSLGSGLTTSPTGAGPVRPLDPDGVFGGTMARRAIYARNGVSRVSARSWRRSAKARDLEALRAAKASVNAAVIGTAAAELVDLAKALLGPPAGWMVSTVAVGHSRRPDSLAVRVAQAVAAGLDLPFAKLWADRFCSGVSHPKENRKLPPLTWAARPNRPVLLIDDVATSGWHAEEALTAIRSCGVPAVALVWLSGALR